MASLLATIATCSALVIAPLGCTNSVNQSPGSETGGSAGSGGIGVAGNPAAGSGGAACVASALKCPAPVDLGETGLASLDIPGVGNVYPALAQGGTGAGGAPTSGCVTVDDPTSCALGATCHGRAMLQPITGGGDPRYFDVKYADGSVARVFASHSLPPVVEAEIDVSVSTYWDPDAAGCFSSNREFSGRTLSGADLWVQEYGLSLGQAAGFFGAPVTELESCAAEHVFDHIVHSNPEQRIAAGEIASVRAALGTYDVSWYRSQPAPTACAVSADPTDTFSAVLTAE